MLNKAIMIGRLTRDPELRHTQSNMAVASFTIAINRDYKDTNGEFQADFIDCVAWGRMGEFVKQWFTKGMLAVVVGRIQSRNWEDKNGNKRTTIEINVSEMQFGETKKARAANGSTISAPSSYNAPPSITPDASDFAELGDDDDGDVPF